MNYLNLFKISGKALLRNRLRALLTALGIIIGVASVIAMLSLGEGSKRSILSEMSDMGTNMVMIMPSSQSRGGVNLGGSTNTLKMSDIEALRSEADLLSEISPQVQTSAQVIYGNENYQTSIYGVNPEYLSIRKLAIQDGRIFTDNEVRGMAKVCILGQTVIDEVFGENYNPVGLTIRIRNIPFQIIGTLEDKGESSMGQDQDNMIIAPFTTVQRRMANIDYLNGIYASAVSEDQSQQAITQVEEILRRTHRLKESEDNDFNVMSQDELLSTVSTVTDILTYLLGAIAGISLLVGGIGIMNIMFVSVTERTREIGLRMSVGGRSIDIMLQFLIEAVLLSITGGAFGILLGYLLALLAGSLLGVEAAILTTFVVLSFLVCAGIGVFFGWYPARKAANMNPIDALRYE